MSKPKITRGVLVVAAFLMTFTMPALASTDDDHGEVLRTVQTLLDGWREADASKLEAVLHPRFPEVTLHLQDCKWNFSVEERDKLIKTNARISKGGSDQQFIYPQVHLNP